MGKKRRVWWVVGSFVVVVALFTAIAFVVDYNSTDARIERAVAQIVEEYGFELKSRSPISLGSPPNRVVRIAFKRSPVSAESADEIVAILREACPSLEYKYWLIEGFELPEEFSGPFEIHNFISSDQDGGLIAGIEFNPNDLGHGRPENEPEAHLFVAKFDRPGLWQRIKGLWPW